MPLLPVLARMEVAGVLIDRDALRAMSEQFAEQLGDLEARIFAVGRARVQHRLALAS